jgi:hypothetical protein
VRETSLGYADLLFFVARDLDERRYPYAGAVRQAARRLAELEQKPQKGDACASCGGLLHRRLGAGRPPKYCPDCSRSRRRPIFAEMPPWRPEVVKRLTETMVPISVIADKLTGNNFVVRAWCERLGIDIGTAWDGEEAIRESEAARLVAEYKQEIAAHAQRLSDYDAYRQEHERRKQKMAQEAYERVVQERKKRDAEGLAGFADHVMVDLEGPGSIKVVTSPVTKAEAREAAQAAAAEIADPLPFEDWAKKR